jgi:hypothetical protein
MNSNNQTNAGQQNRKRRWLPLVALVAGLGLPAFAWANDCMAGCVNGCSTTFWSEVSYCNGDQGCIDAAQARMYACFNQCYNYCGM